MTDRMQVVSVGVVGPPGPGLSTHEAQTNTFMHVVQCTSTTRPGSPIEGQVVYETDTNLFKVYSGSAWVDIRALTKAPAARAYLTADQTGIVTGTPTTLAFGTESYDTHGIHAVGIFTIPTGYAGKWYAKAQVNWFASSLGDFREVSIYHNNTDTLAVGRSTPLATNDTYTQVSDILHCAVGDTIRFRAQHDAGENKTAQGGSNEESFGVVCFLGA